MLKTTGRCLITKLHVSAGTPANAMPERTPDSPRNILVKNLHLPSGSCRKVTSTAQQALVTKFPISPSPHRLKNQMSVL